MTSKAEKNKEKLNKLRQNTISPTGAMIGVLDASPNVTTSNPKEESSNVVIENPPVPEPSPILPKQEVEVPSLDTTDENIEIHDVGTVEENENTNTVIKETKLPELELSMTTTAPKGRFGKLKNKAKKQRVEDTHSRKTFLVRNDLLEELETISEGIHGFKIEFINTAIENALKDYRDELEGE